MRFKMFFLLFLMVFTVGCNNTTTLTEPLTLPQETENFIVQFLDSENKVISVQIVQSGQNAVAPQPETLTGYDFVGWDKQFTNVTTNLVVKATYQIKSYTIIFDSLGGSPVASVIQNYGTVLTLVTPVREGYVFLGWYLGNDINSLRVYTGDLVTENLNLYARWQKSFAITVYSETELVAALNNPLYEEIYLGADIETAETLNIPRSLTIFGNDFKLLVSNPYEVFNIVNNDNFTVRKKPMSTTRDGFLKIYDLNIIGVNDEVSSAYVFDLYDLYEYNFDFYNLNISGNIKHAFSVTYAEYLSINFTNSEIDVEGAGLLLRSVYANDISLKNSRIRAGSPIAMINAEDNHFYAIDSFFTIIDSEIEEMIAIIALHDASYNYFNFHRTNFDTETTTASYIVNSRSENFNQTIAFSLCTFEVNNAVFSDLFFSESSYLYLYYNESTIILKEGITEIPAYGFGEAYDISNIILPSSLETIGEYAFQKCYSLKTLVIPEGVTSIGEGAFQNAWQLTAVVIPASVVEFGEAAFPIDNIMLKIYLMEGIDQSNWAPNWNESDIAVIEDLKASGNLEGVIYLALADNEIIIVDFIYMGISEIIIPETIEISGIDYQVTQINHFAFKDNSSLKTVVISNTVISIGIEAFANNYFLTNVSFSAGSNLETIGRAAFASCFSLKGIIIPASVTELGIFVFEDNLRMESAVFASGSQITSIPIGTFVNNSRLTSITIPASVTIIEEGAFGYCSNLETVLFEENSQLETIAESAFYGLQNLKSFSLPASVTSIGNYAFGNNTSLEEFIIPLDSSLVSIGYSAFAACSSLVSFTFPAEITQIANALFAYCYSLEEVIFPEDSQITSVGNEAFIYTSSLTHITLPATVTTIGFSAFYNSGLVEFYLPELVDTIEYQTFSNCIDLVVFGYENPNNLLTIRERAFGDCPSLVTFFIPDSVTYVGEYAFVYNFDLIVNVEAVTMPAEWNMDWSYLGPTTINYAVNHRTITLEPNNGEDLTVIFEKIGTVILAPVDPVKVGFTFGGWYLDDGTFLIPYAFDVMTEESITIYAKWLPN